MSRLRRSSLFGLSMPELAVAATILFVVSTAIMTMFVTGLRQTGQATQNHDLENLTRQKLAQLRVIPYTQLATQVASDAPFSPPLPDARYRYSVVVTPLAGEDPVRTAVVEVTVTHPDHGSRSARTVRCDVVVDPGQAAFEKFGCVQCHSLPQAGSPTDRFRVPLGPIVPTSTMDYEGRGMPNNTPSESDWETYIEDSIRNPGAVDPFAGSAEGADLAYTTMVGEFYVEGVDSEFDPDSTDPVVAANSMSAAEVQAMGAWLAQFQP